MVSPYSACKAVTPVHYLLKPCVKSMHVYYRDHKKIESLERIILSPRLLRQ